MNIKIDLSEFYDNEKRYSLLYIDPKEKVTVHEVIEYICKTFCIKHDISTDIPSLFADNLYIPPNQSTNVLFDIKDKLRLKLMNSINSDISTSNLKKHKRKYYDKEFLNHNDINKFTSTSLDKNNYQSSSLSSDISLNIRKHKRKKKYCDKDKNENDQYNISNKEKSENDQYNDITSVIPDSKKHKKKIKIINKELINSTKVNYNISPIGEEEYISSSHMQSTPRDNNFELDQILLNKDRNNKIELNNYNKTSDISSPQHYITDGIISGKETRELTADFTPGFTSDLADKFSPKLNLEIKDNCLIGSNSGIKRKRKRKHNKKTKKVKNVSNLEQNIEINDEDKILNNDDFKKQIAKTNMHLVFSSDDESFNDDQIQSSSSNNQLVNCVEEKINSIQVKTNHESNLSNTFINLLNLEKNETIKIFVRKNMDKKKEKITYQERSVNQSFTSRSPPNVSHCNKNTTKLSAEIQSKFYSLLNLEKSPYTHVYYHKKLKNSNLMTSEEVNNLGCEVMGDLPISFTSGKFKVERPHKKFYKNKVQSKMTHNDKEENFCDNSLESHSSLTLLSNGYVSKDSENKRSLENVESLEFIGSKPQMSKSRRYFHSIANVINSLKASSNTDVDKTSYSDVERFSYSDVEKASNSDVERASNSDNEKTSNSDVERVNSDVERVSYSDVEKASNSDVERASNSDDEKISNSDIERGNSDVERVSYSNIEKTSNSDVERASNSDNEKTSNSDVERVSNSDVERANSDCNKGCNSEEYIYYTSYIKNHDKNNLKLFIKTNKEIKSNFMETSNIEITDRIKENATNSTLNENANNSPSNENLTANNSSPNENNNDLHNFYESCPLLRSLPSVGDIIVGKFMSLDETFCPSYSDYRPAKVIAKEGLNISLQYLDNENLPVEKSNSSWRDYIASGHSINNSDVTIDWRDIKDARLIFP